MSMNCDRCERCEYGETVDIWRGPHQYTACMYIAYADRRRPCPPNRECTVFEPRRRGSRFMKEWMFG